MLVILAPDSLAKWERKVNHIGFVLLAQRSELGLDLKPNEIFVAHQTGRVVFMSLGKRH